MNMDMAINPAASPSPPSSPPIGDEQKLNVIEHFTGLLGFYVIGSGTSTKDAISQYNSHRTGAGAGASAAVGIGPVIPSGSSGTSNSSSNTKPQASPIPRSALSLIAERKTNGTYGPSGQGQAHALTPATQFIANSMDRCLYRDDGDTVGGAIISVPALDLQSSPGMIGRDKTSNGDSNASASTSANTDARSNNNSSSSTNINNQPVHDSASASSILPSIGESTNPNINNQATTTAAPTSKGNSSNTPAIPAMVASVFGHCNNDHLPFPYTPTSTSTMPVQPENPATAATIVASTPPSNVGKASPGSASNVNAQQLQEATSKATGIEYAAASNLGRPISYTRSSAPHAPSAMTRTFIDSFSSLVESRFKAWTLLLLRHSLSSGDEDSRTRLMSLLATNKIDLSAAVTTFKVDKKKKEVVEKKDPNAIGFSKYSRENCDHILPLKMDINIDLKLQGKIINLHLEAPGTIAAAFHEGTHFLTYFQCQIDANSLVSDMIAQARLVVLKAVAKATSCNANHLYNSTDTDQTLSQFGSSLNLSTVGGSGRSTTTTRTASTMARGAKSNVILTTSRSSNFQTELGRPQISRPQKVSGESVTLGSNKRQRSVTWDNSVNDLNRVQSVLKKPKRMNSLKRSIVSFGKPNSGFFKSAKNATFAEFGNLTTNPNVAEAARRNGQNHLFQKTHQSSMNLSARHSLDLNVDGRNMNASFSSSPVPRTPTTQSSLLSTLSSSSSTATPTLLSSHALLRRKPTFTELSRNAKYSQAPSRPQNSLLSFTSQLGGSGSSSLQNSHNNLKRTPTQLENVLIRRTRASQPNNGGGNANWG